MRSHAFYLLASVSTVSSQERPESTSICDFYTNALFGSNNATAQMSLLTALINTVVIGNYTTPNKNAVPGILAPDATYNDTKVNLAKYFNGSMKSTNVGKSHGVAVNFLDGGGADPLKDSKPAAGKESHQYKLLTHLYSYFGLLLGCSQIGQQGFPKYRGDTSMYEVHKFMSLDAYEVQYFIQQVGLAATSFGVSIEDAGAVGNALQDLFGYKCAPKTSVDYVGNPELQSICTADDCPKAENATCDAYDQSMHPSSEGPGGMEPSGTGSMPAATGKNGAGSLSLSLHVLASSLGLVAVMLLA